MGIPIKNIYYLLCYAWNKLDEKERVAVSGDDETELIDLFAKVLNNATRILIKRGIDKSYRAHVEELNGIKGKLSFSDSLQRNLLEKQKAICQFDEFSSDILTNQILVSTLRKLLKTKGLNDQHKWESRQLLYKLPGIRSIVLRPAHFKQIRLHRNNRFYEFVLKVCQIIFENTLPGEEPGTYQFADFRRNQRKMNRLFEEFLFQFYRLEPHAFNKVKREQIHWKFTSKKDSMQTFLPLMKTDITLENETQKIIIDAKYYQETLAENYGKKIIKSENLYQVFSYLVNQESRKSLKTLHAKGILLYPTIRKEYDLSYSFGNHSIEIRTVNLDQDWRLIRERLLGVID